MNAGARAARAGGRAPRALRAVSEALVRVERLVSRLMVLGFVGLITVNVAMRYGAGRPIIFAEELAAILLVWLAFVAISISIHDRNQIGVTILADALPEPVRVWLDRFVSALIIAMLAVLLWKSLVWVRSPSVAFEQVITTGWAKWPFFVIVPIFCATALIHVAVHLFEERRP